MDKRIDFVTSHSSPLQGQCQLPGDKSISHRALLLAAIADGTSIFEGLLWGKDNQATYHALRQLGVPIRRQGAVTQVQGVGKHGLCVSPTVLDCANSGTTMRMLAGLLSAQPFKAQLQGDASLQNRPMQRIIEPLRQMGAVIKARDNAYAPLQIQGQPKLAAIRYRLPIASAQVKSCLLLAGLYADGVTHVAEAQATRDHTERLLRVMRYPVRQRRGVVQLPGGGLVQPCHVAIPGDLSSAAFFIVAATLMPRSDIVLQRVGINPTRLGLIRLLQAMGADIAMSHKTYYGLEPVADIRVKSAILSGINIDPGLVPSAIDEFPVLFVAAACAKGRTVLRQAQELTVKESNRLQVMAKALSTLGITTDLLPDGIIIEGGHLQGGTVESAADHRVAMALCVAGWVAQQPVHITDCQAVATSFPNFVPLARHLGLNVKVIRKGLHATTFN